MMKLQGNGGLLESQFGPFGYSVTVGNQFGECKCLHKIVARFAPNIPYAWKSFWTHQIELLGEVSRVEPRFGPFRDSVSVGAG
jgi:hypothetical protein